MAKELTEKRIATVEEYIKLQPPAVRTVLKEFRTLIQKAAPGAEEVISYGMPTYRLNGVVAHFAVFTNHCSIFLPPAYLDHFRVSLKQTTTKAAVHFPLDEPLPASLISRMVKYSLAQNNLKADSKRKK